MQALQKKVIEKELEIINKNNIKDLLLSLLTDRDKLRNFAESFYFIRYAFIKLNFLAGARCNNNERLFSGIVKNLYEEIGGEKGKSHNELYRDFLKEIGAKNEVDLENGEEPEFSQKFNLDWEKYIRTVPLPEALMALAIYEIFDNPDYQMLYEVVRSLGVSKRGYSFFAVHSNVAHFELFEDLFSEFKNDPLFDLHFENALGFILSSQERMWVGLITHLRSAKAN